MFLTFFFQLCFAYKGVLKDTVSLQFTYRNSTGTTVSQTASIATVFNKGPESVNMNYYSSVLLKPVVFN